MELLRLGVLGRSAKENESRLAIHPGQFDRIDEDVRAHMVLERGYGLRYGVSDARLEPMVAGFASREEVIATTDVVLMPKPTRSDVAELADGQVLWGWPHMVQDRELTQLAIDKRLTVIAWEAMNVWSSSGQFVVHVFHQNNELAGYASVFHALALTGSTGHYGRALRAAVLGFGNTARGAVTGLQAIGVHDVTVMTAREVAQVASPMPAAVLRNVYRSEDDPDIIMVETPDGSVEVAVFLADFDIVVNCVLQDTDSPQMFVRDSDLPLFAPGSLFVDVSCDAGMGFEFARPTSFSDPMFTVGDGVNYYGVDHSPAYFWNSATWGISEALIPYLRTVMGGPADWDRDETITRAIEIRDGVLRNPKILSFQGRAADHPHGFL
ncbi:MAG: N(5)-(carboxyethyl)ornithine synthase [Actinomycetes bacterium]